MNAIAVVANKLQPLLPLKAFPLLPNILNAWTIAELEVFFWLESEVQGSGWLTAWCLEQLHQFLSPEFRGIAEWLVPVVKELLQSGWQEHRMKLLPSFIWKLYPKVLFLILVSTWYSKNRICGHIILPQEHLGDALHQLEESKSGEAFGRKTTSHDPSDDPTNQAKCKRHKKKMSNIDEKPCHIMPEKCWVWKGCKFASTTFL